MVGQRLEGRWRGCRPLAACVSVILVLSVVLSYASPPDPSWIPGIYDDHDYDDVVGMVTDGTGLSDSQAPELVEFVLAGFVLGASWTGLVPNPTGYRQTIRGPTNDPRDAPAGLLLTSPGKASRLSCISLIRGAVSPSALVHLLGHLPSATRGGGYPPPVCEDSATWTTWVGPWRASI